MEEIRTTLRKFEKVYLSHKYRESNSVADWLANEVVKNDMARIWTIGGNILITTKGIIDQERI